MPGKIMGMYHLLHPPTHDHHMKISVLNLRSKAINQSRGRTFRSAVIWILASCALFMPKLIELAVAMTPKANQTTNPSEASIRVIGISQALGLMDLEIEGLPDDAEAEIVWTIGPDRFSIRTQPEGSTAPSKGTRTVRLHITPEARAQLTELALVRPDHPRQIFDVELLNASPAPGEATPDWAKGVVWYQILPDRFFNGTSSNDPRPSVPPLGKEPANPWGEVYPKAWNSDWSRPSVDEFEAALLARAGVLGSSGPGIPRQATRARPSGFMSVVFLRRYGGDLQGVIQKLDHLQMLGVGAIYLCPIFSAPSLHKYDAADHRHIDPTLSVGDRLAPDAARLESRAPWPRTQADEYFFNDFLPALHDRGFRLVLDGVWNHVGTQHWAFQDIVANGKGSKFASWFRLKFLPDGQLDSWKAWDSTDGTLPGFARTSSGGLVSEVEAHIFDVTRTWMAPSPISGRGIDGWRLDVAGELSLEFWQRWNAHVKAINPEAITLAEVWHDERSYTTPTPPTTTHPASIADATPNRAFDAQMNYPFARSIVGWLQRPESYTSTRLASELTHQLTRHPATNLVQMNLVGSHDTQRVLSALHNPSADYDSGGAIGPGSPRYDRTKPSAGAYAKARLALAIQALSEGAPMVYYGDEFGVFGGKDPDCRKPLPWPEFSPYLVPDDEPDKAMLAWFQAWLALRRDATLGPALRLGASTFPVTGRSDVLAIHRQLNTTRVMLIVNAGNVPYQASHLLSGSWSVCTPAMTKQAHASNEATTISPNSAEVFFIR
jgi:cyclomaltodextrinase / maltogenic alpha-amylase / neopullulanase